MATIIPEFTRNQNKVIILMCAISIKFRAASVVNNSICTGYFT